MKTTLFQSLNWELGPTLIVLVERQEGAHLRSWKFSPKRGSATLLPLRGLLVRVTAMPHYTTSVHRYAPLHHFCPPKELFELPATGHSPMLLCRVHFRGIHIALGKAESLGKRQQILSRTFPCLGFFITFSEYNLQDVWDLSPTICCSFSLVL